MSKNTSILESGESNDICVTPSQTEYGVHGNRIMTEDDDWLNNLMVYTFLFFLVHCLFGYNLYATVHL